MVYMLTCEVYWWQMLPYIPYVDPMGIHAYIRFHLIFRWHWMTENTTVHHSKHSLTLTLYVHYISCDIDMVYIHTSTLFLDQQRVLIYVLIPFGALNVINALVLFHPSCTCVRIVTICIFFSWFTYSGQWQRPYRDLIITDVSEGKPPNGKEKLDLRIWSPTFQW